MTKEEREEARGVLRRLQGPARGGCGAAMAGRSRPQSAPSGRLTAFSGPSCLLVASSIIFLLQPDGTFKRSPYSHRRSEHFLENFGGIPADLSDFVRMWFSLQRYF